MFPIMIGIMPSILVSHPLTGDSTSDRLMLMQNQPSLVIGKLSEF